MKTDVIYGLADVSLYLGKLGKRDYMRTVEVACSEITQLRNKVESLEKMVEDQEERIAIMSEGGWISVNDAMPDDYREVWVWTKGHLIDFGCHQNDYWLLNSFPSPENDRNSFVTHWQYKMIPEPPKEGEAE